MSKLDTDGGACFLSENIGCVATNKIGFADTRVSNNDDYNCNIINKGYKTQTG